MVSFSLILMNTVNALLFMLEPFVVFNHNSLTLHNNSLHEADTQYVWQVVIVH